MFKYCTDVVVPTHCTLFTGSARDTFWAHYMITVNISFTALPNAWMTSH